MFLGSIAVLPAVLITSSRLQSEPAYDHHHYYYTVVVTDRVGGEEE